jgi:arylsulfatase A-like enzyme
MFPTILAAAGVDPPTDRKLDGKNLLPLLIDGKSPGQRRLFWEHGNSLAMRDGTRKVVVGAPGQKQPGLFDLANDLDEQNDLAKQEPARMKEMVAAIEAWEKDVTADASPQPDSPPRDVERQ